MNDDEYWDAQSYYSTFTPEVAPAAMQQVQEITVALPPPEPGAHHLDASHSRPKNSLFLLSVLSRRGETQAKD